MGHNFGMSHDAGTTACPDSGCIMEAVGPVQVRCFSARKPSLLWRGDSVAATQFTECSVSDITTFFSQATHSHLCIVRDTCIALNGSSAGL